MKVLFKNIDQIESFLSITQSMEADVIIKQGQVQLDGKSPVGMMTAPLNYPLTVLVIEKKGISEIENFIKRIDAIGVLYKTH